MSIRELYEFAVKNGMEDKPLRLKYFCDDSWYTWDGDIVPHVARSSNEDEICIEPDDGQIVVTICAATCCGMIP